MNIQLVDKGIIAGFQTYEVINVDTGKTIGYNQTSTEPQPAPTDTTAIADALAQLPEETLDALKQALGI